MLKQEDSAPPGVRFAIYAMAFAWPWGVYETLPVLWLPLSSLLAGVVLVASAIDSLRRKRLDIPFDLLWPALAWAGLTVIGNITGSYELSANAIFAALVYVATVYATRSRDVIAHCLWLSTIAGACVAVLTIASRAGYLIPTAYVIDASGIQETYARLATRVFSSPPTFAFASAFSSGLCTLVVCGVVALHAACTRGIPRAARYFALSATLVMGCALLANALPAFRSAEAWVPLAGLRGSWIDALAFGAALWLAIRIIVRNTASLRRAGASPAHPVVIAVGVGAVAWLALPFDVAPFHGFLLGIAAAYGLREAPEAPRVSERLWLVSPIIVLALFNMWTVSLENRDDPRNYDEVLSADVAQGDRATAFDRIATLRALGIQERHLSLSQARIALAYERPHWAAQSLAQAVSLSEQGRTVLPDPSPNEVQRFLVQLREFGSHSDDAGASLAQETALAATNQTEAALSLLESKARETTNLALLETPDAMAAEALAFLLGAPRAVEELRTWPHEKLAACLDRIDARVEPIPEGFPAELLPMIVAYRPSANGYAVRVWTKVRQVAAEVPMIWVAPQYPPPDASTVAWRKTAPIGKEWWRFT
ncbi:MAG: hypothetical protein WC655_19140, partial [Candidatus Hydrogenedentales bacterium]